MSNAQRDVELTGSADLVALLREVFAVLSGGRQLPTEVTSTESGPYSYTLTTYLTSNRDGLTVYQILDCGEYHYARVPSLVVGEITVADVGVPRAHEVVLRISARAELIEKATATVKRIANAHGLVFVRQRDPS